MWYSGRMVACGAPEPGSIPGVPAIILKRRRAVGTFVHRTEVLSCVAPALTHSIYQGVLLD